MLKLVVTMYPGQVRVREAGRYMDPGRSGRADTDPNLRNRLPNWYIVLAVPESSRHEPFT